ncbi:MAG: Capsule biosynthesis protein CapC [Legionellaceae bacterium]
MTDPLTLAVGLGLAISLIFTEFFGLKAGGMIVPGYMAINLIHPVPIILTLITAAAAFFLVRGLSSFLIIFGHRRRALIVLVAFILGAIGHHLFTHIISNNTSDAYNVVGFLTPGLIASSFDKQGIIETCATIFTISIIVRLILILCIGSALT